MIEKYFRNFSNENFSWMEKIDNCFVASKYSDLR